VIISVLVPQIMYYSIIDIYIYYIANIGIYNNTRVIMKTSENNSTQRFAYYGGFWLYYYTINYYLLVITIQTIWFLFLQFGRGAFLISTGNKYYSFICIVVNIMHLYMSQSYKLSGTKCMYWKPYFLTIRVWNMCVQGWKCGINIWRLSLNIWYFNIFWLSPNKF